MSDRLRIGLAAVVFAGLAVFCALRLHVSTDITLFLPESEDRRLAEISRQILESPLTRGMILSVEAPDEVRAVAAGKALAAALRDDPEIAWLRAGPRPGLGEAFYRLYFPHRLQLLSSEPASELPARLSDAGLGEAARALKLSLAQPLGAALKRLAGADPLQAFPGLLGRLEAARAGPLEVRDDQFVTADGRHAILFLATRSSPFDGTVQRPLLLRIQAAFAAVDRDHVLRLEESGINRFAVASERLIRADIDRISLVSTLAIVATFILFFRSLRVLVLSFVPLLFGLVTAVAAGILVDGSLHGLTLAFGSTLLGVCIDYPILYLHHLVLHPHPDGPRATLRRIRRPLLLAAFSTLGGFTGLAWTTFPGMRQMALFATTGIIGALLSTLWLLPALAPRHDAAVGLHRRTADLLGGALEKLGRSRRGLAAVAFAALAVCAIGLPRLRWSDDLSAMGKPEPALLAEDERVRAQVSRMDSGRFVISTARDAEGALALNDQVYLRLRALKERGAVADFRSLHDLVFSADLQRRNLAALAAAPDLFRRAEAALSAEGFSPGAFDAFAQALAAPPPPLTLDEVLASPLGDLVSSLRVDLGGETGLLTLVRGVTDEAALDAALEGLDGVRYFDQQRLLSRAYGRYRSRAQQLIGAGLVFVFALLLASYRNLRTAVAAFAPALLASACALATLALLGVEVNLLHVVSLLLVLSIGEDYAVFLVAAREPGPLRASAMAVVLCCLSGVLGFGLLALSQLPALRAVGLTTGIGVLLSFLLAPTALLLVPPAGPGGPQTGAPAGPVQETP